MENKQKRPLKNLTELSLKWLADRVRKTESLKEKIQSGQYKVDSAKLASSFVDPEE